MSQVENAFNFTEMDIVELQSTFHVYYCGSQMEHRDNPWHKHPFIEVCYVFGGSATYSEGGEIYSLYPGTLVISRPGIVHQIRDCLKLSLHYIAFELNDNATERWQERYQILAFTSEFIHRNCANTYPILLWNALASMLSAGNLHAASSIKIITHVLIFALMSNYGISNRTRIEIGPLTVYPSSLVQQAVLYVRENLSGNLEIETVAKYLHISKRQLYRLFVQFSGVSFATYVQFTRLKAAANLLSTTDMPLSDISMCIGFHSIQQLCRSFKRRYGITPGEFRKLDRMKKESQPE